MKKTIVFVGHTYMAADDVKNMSYNSESSLLDGDIIIISPELSGYYLGNSFQGKPSLNDDASFLLKQTTEHWRNELLEAINAGRTVIVFLHAVREVYVGTGRTEYSGTGRNARPTRMVAEFEPYSLIPGKFGKITRKSGERIRPTADLGPLASYWKSFGPYSKYEIYIEEFAGVSLLQTSTGAKVVGGFLSYKDKPGKILLLPVPNLDAMIAERTESFVQKSKLGTNPSSGGGLDAAAKKARATKDRDKAKKNAEDSVLSQFLAALVELDAALRSQEDPSPTPEWLGATRYALPEERKLETELAHLDGAIKALRDQRSDLESKIERSRILKGLLFQKGAMLEDSIIQALGTLGYQAERVTEANSQFDVLFVDPEGRRFIGESEGRDDKSIGVEKLDQLERNIREDFARQAEDQANYAKGVLFGNAFRLSEPEKRGQAFTNKCLQAAARSKVSLIATPDLFVVAKHVLETGDENFATLCREALASSGGEVVKFPELPPRTANLAESTGQESSAEVQE